MGTAGTLFIGLLAASGILSATVGAYVAREQRDTAGAGALIGTLAGQATWALAYALQLTSARLDWWLLLDRVVVTGVTVVTAGWFVFVLGYTGYSRHLSRPQLAGIGLPPFLALGAAWTNHLHGRFWRLEPDPAVLAGDLGPYLQFEGGVLYTPWELYLFGFVIAALLVLGRTYVRSQSLHRAQVGAVFVAVLLPLVGNLLFRVVAAPTLAVDVTPVLFAGTGLLVVAALERYRMLDSVPVSQAVLLERLSEGIVVTDGSGEILHANGAATEIIGEGVIGEPLDGQLPPERVQADGAVLSSDFGVEVDGGWRHFDVERTPYTDHRGERRGAIYTFQEVTERQEHAEELARQNERLDRFASFVSHDLRSPLFVASSRLDMVREDVPDEHAGAIERSLDRMETMIEDLLTMARVGRSVEDPGPVALAELVEEVRARVGIDGADIETAVAPDLTVRADRDRLLHVVENLLRNARDHNDPAPTVRVGTLDGPGSGSPVGFFVEDNGTGIPAGEREAAFEHGYTTSDDGSGLGLSLVSDIVAAHGWEITVTEGRDGGARFEITGIECGREG